MGTVKFDKMYENWGWIGTKRISKFSARILARTPKGLKILLKIEGLSEHITELKAGFERVARILMKYLNIKSSLLNSRPGSPVNTSKDWIGVDLKAPVATLMASLAIGSRVFSAVGLAELYATAP